MGHYSNLKIDRLEFSWKYHIPTFLTFLFDSDDFFIVMSDDDPDDQYIAEVGYRTTCGQSLAQLEKFGYDLSFFGEVYSQFRPELDRYLQEMVIEELASECDDDSTPEDEFRQYLERHPAVSPADELRDFAKFLAALYTTDFKSPPYDQPVELEMSDGRTYRIEPDEYLTRHGRSVFVDYESLQMYMLNRYTAFPPWVVMIAGLFDEGYVMDYPEIMSLMFVRLALEGVDHESEIKLDLADILETEEEARSVHSELAQSLVEKVTLYNRVFKVLFEREEDVRTAYVKTQCRELLEEAACVETAHLKGRALERLMEVLFTAVDVLEVAGKNVSTDDEEIDLVVKNNISRPFWSALGSPLLFVECKNWSGPSGPKELRDFEVKLQNHGSLTKLGIFVSLNGFTSGVDEELKRLGRGSYHVVTLSGDDLREFAGSSVGFYDWLESKVARIV